MFMHVNTVVAFFRGRMLRETLPSPRCSGVDDSVCRRRYLRRLPAMLSWTFPGSKFPLSRQVLNVMLVVQGETRRDEMESQGEKGDREREEGGRIVSFRVGFV